MEIKESKGSTPNVLKLDCIVTYMGQHGLARVSWWDGKNNKLSDNSHLEFALKPGDNVFRCKYKVNYWSGTRTLIKNHLVLGFY